MGSAVEEIRFQCKVPSILSYVLSEKLSIFNNKQTLQFGLNYIEKGNFLFK